MKEKAYLSFYDHHGIIPVSQDIDDLRLHFARRRALYKHLGLLPKTIENRTVLEFGPGTADNALYVASCRPALNVLVDGNPASIRAVHEKIDRGLLPREGTECIAAEIGAYTDPRRFDVVLCEGV